ncbi:Mitochondrial fission protein [Balamuthia mandrillaris]
MTTETTDGGGGCGGGSGGGGALRTSEGLLQQQHLASLGAFRVLPNELTVLVFAFLETADLFNVSLACKHWNFLSEDDSLWKPLYMQKWGSLSAVGATRNNGRRRLRGGGGGNRGMGGRFLEEEQLFGWRSWKNRYTTKGNWKNGHAVSESILPVPHTSAVLCLQFNPATSAADYLRRTNTKAPASCLVEDLEEEDSMPGELLITGSADKKLRFVDLATGRQLHCIQGHQAQVTCLQFDSQNDLLATGSKDCTIKLWRGFSSGSSSSLENSEEEGPRCVMTLTGHNAWVSALQLGSNKLLSFSCDLTGRVWDLTTGQCVKTIKGVVPCLAFQATGNKLVCGYMNSTIKVWDIRIWQAHRTLHGHRDFVRCLQFEDHNLVSGSSDKTVKMWDMRASKCLWTIDRAHKGRVMDLQFQDTRLVTAGSDHMVNVWNLKTRTLTASFSRHSATVNTLQFDDKKIISGGSDGKVAITSFSEVLPY